MSKNKNTLTGATLEEIFSRRGLTRYGVAKTSKTSQSFVSQVTSGKRTPSPQWLDIVADATGLTPKERENLHRAAAKDHGFKIDLTSED